MGLKWKGIQSFFHTRYSYFDLSFLLCYFSEQIGLSYLIWRGFDAQLVAGIFSIIIITTASIQNKCWESRTKEIGETSIEQNTIIGMLKDNNEKVLSDNKKLNENLKDSKTLIERLFLELKMSQDKLKKK